MRKIIITVLSMLIMWTMAAPAASGVEGFQLDEAMRQLKKTEIVAVLEAELRLIETRTDVIERQKADIQRQIGDTNAQRDLTSQQIDDLEHQIDEYRHELDDFKNQTDDSLKQTEEYLKAVESFERQIEALRKQVDYLSVSYYDHIPDLRRQIVLLDENRKSLASQMELLRQRIEQENKLAEFILQSDYYAISLLYEKAGLLERQIALINKQMETGEVRLRLGMATQADVDALSDLWEAVALELQIIRKQIENDRKTFFLNFEKIDGDFAFRAPGSFEERYANTVDEFLEAVFRNNRLLKEYKSLIDNQSDMQNALRSFGGANDPYYREAAAQYSLYAAQRDELLRNIGLFVRSRYAEYEKLEVQYQASTSARRTLQHRLSVNETRYKAGLISETEYLNNQYEINKTQYDLNALCAAMAISVRELQLLEEGVVIS